MKSNNPNRLKRQFANFDAVLQKKSGDQHFGAEAENQDASHRPHRASREDLQKLEEPGYRDEES